MKPTPPFLTTRIRNIRGVRVMLGPDLAALYGVPTKALVQAVKRNRDRFPPDFAFQLMKQEVSALRSQTVTLDEADPRPRGRGRHPKYAPYAFTGERVASDSFRAIGIRAPLAQA
jgi:hypothetical protein